MKKLFAVLLVATMAVVCIFYFKGAPKTPEQSAEAGSETKKPAESAPEKKSVSRAAEAPEPKVESADKTAVAAKPAVAASNESGDKTIVHTHTDFEKGQFDNMALDGGIHLGNDTTPTTFQNKYKLFGLFHSLPEDIPATFDMVTPSYQGTVPEGSALEFSLRTRSPEGNWSPWIEVKAESMGQPIMLDAPAMSLQYKLTLFANDSASSPMITNVTLVTKNTVPKAVPLAQGSNSAGSGPNPSK
jgi:hypothetical protein